ncbi:nucleotide diphosphate [Samia ricini nucleopolyhedrovirus]|nr:NUDIX hydrolase [Philosamia cynthia ricini nucleopolyhedrovirus virus]BBD51193.1 nucleotide diphosphate [Samia ricini nucleopolyhedrovirus]BBD51345.1 nucleotide diphosphate [Samia ricini nucleopolyhedrovirus]BBD51497.1 nucleotide diphosphate [Samia ricini nucleopolyhedrovirus]
MRNSAGLFMIMEPDKAVLLCARRAYRGGVAAHDTFLEKLSIPRGHRDCTDAKIYETAVREFVEETGRFFHKAHIYKFPFTLHWTDEGVTYKYSIYVGVVRGALVNVQFKPNTYSVKLLPGVVGNDYRIVLRPRRYNCEIARSLAIVPLNQYFEYMINKQLTTYAASNYGEFFDFVRQVKRLFDDNQLHDFFYASLKRVEPHDEQR